MLRDFYTISGQIIHMTQPEPVTRRGQFVVSQKEKVKNGKNYVTHVTKTSAY